MRLLIPLLLVSLMFAQAQAPDTRPTEGKAAAADPKLHADVLKLVELSGAR